MYKFKSQFDPEGQGHQSSFQLSQMPLNEQFKSEGKKKVQKLSHLQGITKNFLFSKPIRP